jgi:hypothetical protein
MGDAPSTNTRKALTVTVVTLRDLVDAHLGTYMLNHKPEVDLNLLRALSF